MKTSALTLEQRVKRNEQFIKMLMVIAALIVVAIIAVNAAAVLDIKKPEAVTSGLYINL